MKKIGFLTVISFLFFVQANAVRKVTITNTSPVNRKAEMVEVKVSDLKLSFGTKTYVLTDMNNKELPYQIIYDGSQKPRSIIFETDVNVGSSVSYIFTEGTPATVKPRTSAQFVPERKDDFAWENDLAAYRMYGPALAAENPSNGVDLWLKSTDEIVVAKRYRDELQNGITYHVDHGNGLDCYKVGHTLGAGGIAPFKSGKLWIGNHFSSYKIIETGPLRSVFELIYDSVEVDKQFYKQTIRITTTAGATLNKAEVRFEGKKQDMKLAAGIYLHDGKGVVKNEPNNGIIAYSENAVSDAGLPSGRNYVGVYIPVDKTESKINDTHLLICADYKAGDTFVYYFGGGWSKWKFPTDNDWFNAVTKLRDCIQYPLKVTVK